ncbi:ATP-grasp domain-containing protein [Rhizobium mongolense]|uniref:ATP-grasp domain-containing protein n=1 Tax=Rhizobium mongolense TaxID=57676 RepID=UPI0035567A71
MARRALILVEGTRSNGPRFVKAAQRLGLHPITLSIDPAQYDYLAAENVSAIRVDTKDLSALIHECSRLGESYDIAGITSAWEPFYATVGKLCQHFDLPGPDPTSIEKCCDKFTQRQLLAEAGVPIPAFRLAINATDIRAFAAEIGLPVVLKPVVGIGSRGVRLCRNVDELAEHTDYLLGEQYKWQTSPGILVEEFAQGPYYGANMMGNELIAVGVAAFGPPPHFVFREYTHPASLTDDEYERIADVSRNCLRALRLGWGPSNIEFRWTTRGPVVIEVNPRLSGGDPKLVQLACGVDLITEHIKLVAGEESDLRKSYSQTATAWYLVPENDGTLDWIDGISQAAAAPGIAEVKLYVEPKMPVVRRGDDRDYLGYVIASSHSPTHTAAMLRRAVDLISWSIAPRAGLGEQEQPASRNDLRSAQILQVTNDCRGR